MSFHCYANLSKKFAKGIKTEIMAESASTKYLEMYVALFKFLVLRFWETMYQLRFL